jgi:cell division septation protein DedD
MQQELFEDLQAKKNRGNRQPFPLFPGRFVTLKVAYEDIVCGVLILVLLLLGGFSIGVERGKQLVTAPAVLLPMLAQERAVSPEPKPQPEADPPPEGKPDVAEVPTETQLVRATLTAPVSPPKPVKKAEPVPAVISSGPTYVIQLASYSGARTARGEADRLRKKGVVARVIKQGRYFELRAIGFRSQDEARASLVDLRKIYRDAFIKRLSSG